MIDKLLSIWEETYKKGHLINYSILEQPETPIISRNNKTLYSSNENENEWFLDGEIINGEKSNSIEATSTGVYTVRSKGQNGCYSKFSKGEYGIILGNLNEISTKIYPNPFHESLTITFNQDLGDKVDIRISNTLGQEVFSKSGITNGQSINLKQLPAGQYILNIQSMEKNGKGYNLKIVKE
ncbi:MAG: hypothetical protein RIR51_756 [Bacteroidota bacterium]|jgi:hypothetical protein